MPSCATHPSSGSAAARLASAFALAARSTSGLPYLAGHSSSKIQQTHQAWPYMLRQLVKAYMLLLQTVCDTTYCIPSVWSYLASPVRLPFFLVPLLLLLPAAAAPTASVSAACSWTSCCSSSSRPGTATRAASSWLSCAGPDPALPAPAAAAAD